MLWLHLGVIFGGVLLLHAVLSGLGALGSVIDWPLWHGYTGQNRNTLAWG